jgi:hypothetical protein
MGEKETASSAAGPSSEVMFNPKEYTIQRAAEESLPGGAEESVQWEPHKAPGLDLPEQERAAGAATDAEDAGLKTRHDTVKNSIGNIR